MINNFIYLLGLQFSTISADTSCLHSSRKTFVSRPLSACRIRNSSSNINLFQDEGEILTRYFIIVYIYINNINLTLTDIIEAEVLVQIVDTKKVKEMFLNIYLI